jgi:hypothetical protein
MRLGRLTIKGGCGFEWRGWRSPAYNERRRLYWLGLCWTWEYREIKPRWGKDTAVEETHA